jgi:hypothetical protein
MKRSVKYIITAAANGGIASLLQSARLVAAVAELGSLGYIARPYESS